MTTERLAEIDLVELKGLVEKATPGDWQYEGRYIWIADGIQSCCGNWREDPYGEPSCCGEPDVAWQQVQIGEAGEQDAPLIALAPTLARQVLALSEKVERLKAPAEPPKLTDLNWPDGRPKIAPVQGYASGIPWSLHLKAYEVYCKFYGSQDALIDLAGRGCRGGFGVGELDMFIPGWRDEVEELGKLRAALRTAEAREARLREALEAALYIVAPLEPEDSRAVSDIFVALAAELAGCADDKSAAVVEAFNSKSRAALAAPKDGEKK